MCLSEMAQDEGDLDVQRWCEWQQSVMLRSLSPADSHEMLNWWVNVSIKCGGKFLKEMQVLFSFVLQMY